VPTRRILLACVALTALAPRLARAQQDQLSTAAEFIRQSGNELAAVAAQAKSSPAGRARLSQFVDRVADVNAVGRFCLGRYWRSATPAQQQQFMQAFHQVLVNSVANRLGDYEGGTARVIIARPVQSADGINVATTVERPGAAPVHVTWVVSMETGSPKIVDVIAEGMSMRLTQRSDYASFLARNNNNLDALIQALQRQAAASG
jgi:phospholipid transport system substrate-binding protein